MRIDRQQAFSGTTAADIDAAVLEAYLKQHIEGFSGPLTLARFKGGQSNPTYKLITQHRTWVMRAKPGPVAKLLPSAHAIDREFRVMDALSKAGFPAAKQYALLPHSKSRLES